MARFRYTPELELRLQPKTSLGNLFGMLEYAYNIRGLKFFPGVTGAESLQEFYSQLARLLARRVLERSRKGLYHAYRSDDDVLPFVRGRIEMAQAVTRPWSVRLACQYQEHTADIDDNRILTWTLWRILRTGYCDESAASLVRQAYRTLQGVTELQPYAAGSCLARPYQRLNEDYRPLHALCRFFLDNSGPAHNTGTADMVPFLVNMASLFEQFVAAWLEENLHARWALKAQDGFSLDSKGQYRFVPDLVIYERATNEVRCILDTKYKVVDKPSDDDIAQVIAYAFMKQSPEAVLVYPVQPKVPLDVTRYGIRVRSVSFDLEKDLEQAGQKFLADLGLAECRVDA